MKPRAAAALALLVSTAAFGASWRNFGRDPQHQARSSRAAQKMTTIRWRTTVDLDPYKNDSGALLVHYGPPVVTARNVVVLPVKTGFTDGFRVEGRNGRTGTLLWQLETDYSLPPHTWVPPCGICLGPDDRVFVPGAGGTILVRGFPDLVGIDPTRRAFYGDAEYAANKAELDATVKICTPLVADEDGTVYFGFLAEAGAPLGLVSGFARVPLTGEPTWTAASDAAGDVDFTRPAWAAPAVSRDGNVYVAVRNAANAGHLCRLDAATLEPLSSVRLKDPLEPGKDVRVLDLSTASPTVGPDGDVYFGVVEGVGVPHRFHGWLMHCNPTLDQSKTPGAFGWDDTASIVPRSAVPQYRGRSKYLVLVKHNDYVQTGGLGLSRLVILDPNDSQTDEVGGALVMREVISVLAPTIDEELVDATHPEPRREWCVNTVAVDPRTKCAVVNNEDGICYRWDFRRNALVQPVRLTEGLSEAYTPTVIGVDGAVYAINDATLFCVGRKRR
jgi:hypothetical protein